MMGTLKTERWDLKGCEIFYGFVKFSFRMNAFDSFKCKFSASLRFAPCRALMAAIADRRETAQLRLKRLQIGQTF
jgi:hypothetical protein